MESDNNKDKAVWYAVRTFNRKELEVSAYLTENNIPHFIPMVYTMRGRANERPKRMLVPVVHNLLFIEKTLPETKIKEIVGQCKVPVTIFKQDGTDKAYEIPESQMIEFRAVCDPDYPGTLFVTKEMADAKVGKEVRIIQGPFKGITGKLVRFNNDYFIVKTLISVGVMLRISRWYCEIIK